MSIGPLELALFGATVILALAAHLIIARLSRGTGQQARYRVFLIYGIPVFFAAAAILTPPDIISMLWVAVLCSLVYGVVAATWAFTRFL